MILLLQQSLFSADDLLDRFLNALVCSDYAQHHVGIIVIPGNEKLLGKRLADLLDSREIQRDVSLALDCIDQLGCLGFRDQPILTQKRLWRI